MDEIVKAVAEKTGMSEEMARTAVVTVLDMLKDKLPEGLAGQVDAFVDGGGSANQMGTVLKGLGGLFGSK